MLKWFVCSVLYAKRLSQEDLLLTLIQRNWCNYTVTKRTRRVIYNIHVQLSHNLIPRKELYFKTQFRPKYDVLEQAYFLKIAFGSRILIMLRESWDYRNVLNMQPHVLHYSTVCFQFNILISMLLASCRYICSHSNCTASSALITLRPLYAPF